MTVSEQQRRKEERNWYQRQAELTRLRVALRALRLAESTPGAPLASYLVTISAARYALRATFPDRPLPPATESLQAKRTREQWRQQITAAEQITALMIHPDCRELERTPRLADYHRLDALLCHVEQPPDPAEPRPTPRGFG